MNRITEINRTTQAFQVNNSDWFDPQSLEVENVKAWSIGDELIVSSFGGISCTVENKTKGIVITAYRK